MSELITYPKSYVYDQLGNKPRGNLYYLKYEADKVILELKARVAQLEDDNALLRNNNAELRSKNEGLLYALADAETDLAMATRWRKCSEELPEDENEDYLVFAGDAIYIASLMQFVDDDGKSYREFFIDAPTDSKPTHWQFLPKAPEVK